MVIFWWDVREILSDIGYSIRSILKKIFKNIGISIIEFLLMSITMVRFILYKVMCIVMAITSICFTVGLILLILNIYEALNGTWFIDTKYFEPMSYLLGSHAVAFFICKILKPDVEI